MTLSKDQASISKVESLLAGIWADDFTDEFRSLFENGTVEATDEVVDWLEDQVNWSVSVHGEVIEPNLKGD